MSLHLPAARQEQHLRILYIEDDAGLACLLSKNLRRNGYDVEIAVDGEAGLDRAQSGSYDLVLSDHDLPKRNGLEILKILGDDKSAPRVIMVTGNEDLADEALKMGAASFVVKDVHGRYRELLPTIIHRVMNDRPA